MSHRRSAENYASSYIISLFLLISCHFVVLINNSLTDGCPWSFYSVEISHKGLYWDSPPPLSSLSLPCFSFSLFLWFSNDTLSFLLRLLLRIAVPQNGWCRNGPLDAIWSKPTAQARRARYPGPCPGGYWRSPRKETPQPSWVPWASAQ